MRSRFSIPRTSLRISIKRRVRKNYIPATRSRAERDRQFFLARHSSPRFILISHTLAALFSLCVSSHSPRRYLVRSIYTLGPYFFRVCEREEGYAVRAGSLFARARSEFQKCDDARGMRVYTLFSPLRSLSLSLSLSSTRDIMKSSSSSSSESSRAHEWEKEKGRAGWRRVRWESCKFRGISVVRTRVESNSKLNFDPLRARCGTHCARA